MILAGLLGAMALAVLAFWMGEAGGGFVGFFNALLYGLFLAVVAAAWRGPVWRRVCLGVGSLSLWLAAFMAGQHSAGDAFNGCITNGETVRLALAVYFKQHGTYPVTLAKLPGPLPCERLLQPSLLHYRLTDGGYELSFGDAMVLFVASESEAFDARK